MFYDNRYDDNIVLRREAFQNLLTNIKNYPIVDIDFVDEFEQDEIHNNNIWKDYTNNTPCLKITYGDSSTEKGNTMFASVEQKKYLYEAKRELEKLKRELNNRIYRETKLSQAKENNERFLEQEKQQLERIKSKVDLITEKKEAYLMACLSVLLFPYEKDKIYPDFDSLWKTDNNQNGILSNTKTDFHYQTFSLEYNPDIAPNHETITLTYSQLGNYSRLIALLNTLKNSQTNEQYNFNEDERDFFDSFIEFLRGYNYLSFVESLELQGFTQQEIESFQKDKQNSGNGVLTDDSWNKIHQKFVEILNDPWWHWGESSTPDFPAMINNYKKNIENIITKIIGDDEHPGIINNNITAINEALNILLRGNDVDPELILNNDYYKDSIAYQKQLIKKQQNDIAMKEAEFLNPSVAQDKMVYGYKYIRLDTNIKFTDNFDSYINLIETPTASQQSGSFRININNNKIEVPIKGFGAGLSSVSDQDIYIRTAEKEGNGGNINFLGNVQGQGSIITNRGHIYASQGSVAAAGFLALKSSIDRTDNVAGFRYNGTKHLFETFDITGHALYNNEEYSTNLKDYELVTLPDVDTGYIYIQQEYAHNETNTIDASKDNRLDWTGANALETDDINNKKENSLKVFVRKIDENNLNTYYEKTKQNHDLNNSTEFNKEIGIANQNRIILDVEDNTVVIKTTKELMPYSRMIDVFRPTKVAQDNFQECADDINRILNNLHIDEIEATVSIDDKEQYIITNYQEIINTLNTKLEDETLTSGEIEDIQNGKSEIETEYESLQEKYQIFLKGDITDDVSKKRPWICLNFNLSDYTGTSLVNLKWSYNVVATNDIIKAEQMGLSNQNLIFWLNLRNYTDIIKVTLTPPEDSGKIPTSFFIRYDGIDNSTGEIGEYTNTPQKVNPIIEKIQFYTPTTSRTDLIKFSTSQLYLTKKNMDNENISATLKINPDDNYIEAYKVDPNYNDSSDLASLRFQNADIKGKAYIDGTLDISDRAIFDMRTIYLRLPSVAKTITPINNESDLGHDDDENKNYWRNIYGINGIFDHIDLNGTPLENVLPSSDNLGDSTQFWRGGVREDENGEETLPGWTNELTGQLILTNGNGATGINVPTDSAPTTQTGAVFICKGAGYFGRNLSAEKVFNAVYNDYAEYRQTINLEPGRVVIDNDNGSLSCASMRLQPGAQIISDTFGHAMGFTDDCQTPLAVAGRVLVYPYQDRTKYHAGMAVCSAPNGTVDIMTREEIKEYPDCIIGIVSEIPEYDTWGSDNIKVNNRIWIKIK